MNRAALLFDRPEGRSAREPPEARGRGRDDVRLLVTHPDGHRHARFEALPRFLEAGDLLVANESATIPASLPATSRWGPILLNLSTRFRSDLWIAEPRWSSARPGPLPVEAGEELAIGDATVRLLSEYPEIPRLWFALADRPFDSIVAEAGRPIHYGYTDAWPMDVYRTLFARVPGSVEMPSAARPITPRLMERLARNGVRFATILLHTGVSSLEVETERVEAQAMYPEPFSVSRETADAVNRTHAAGRRVIAIGTTVVRALESAWTPAGVRPLSGFTRVFVNPDRGVHTVDGLLTGFHDPMTSHLAMLAAFLGIDRVREAYAEVVRNRYLWHEFGDSHLILPEDGAGGGAGATSSPWALRGSAYPKSVSAR